MQPRSFWWNLHTKKWVTARYYRYRAQVNIHICNFRETCRIVVRLHKILHKILRRISHTIIMLLVTNITTYVCDILFPADSCSALVLTSDLQTSSRRLQNRNSICHLSQVFCCTPFQATWQRCAKDTEKSPWTTLTISLCNHVMAA